MERLDAIVAEMESDRLPLETLIARYEEGVGLLRSCQEKLKAAEQRIEILSRRAGENLDLEPFSPSSDER